MMAVGTFDQSNAVSLSTDVAHIWNRLWWARLISLIVEGMDPNSLVTLSIAWYAFFLPTISHNALESLHLNCESRDPEDSMSTYLRSQQHNANNVIDTWTRAGCVIAGNRRNTTVKHSYMVYYMYGVCSIRDESVSNATGLQLISKPTDESVSIY